MKTRLVLLSPSWHLKINLHIPLQHTISQCRWEKTPAAPPYPHKLPTDQRHAPGPTQGRNVETLHGLMFYKQNSIGI